MSVTPFAPAPFTNPIVAPSATTLTRRQPYISPSELKAAPTALALNNLVPGGSAAQQASELYNVLLRASDWVDLICFHGPDGTLAASPTIQAGWVTPKYGRLALICNFKPVLAVTGVALGSGPQQLADIGDAASRWISIETSIIALHALAPVLAGGFGSVWSSGRWRTYAVWAYVAGYPHMVLAQPCAAGDTQITVAGSVPGQAEPYGVFAGTQLTVRDPAQNSGVEVVVVQSVAGATLTLASPLQYAHKVPSPPDFVYVTALPHGVEQATISLASCLIKLRGTRAAVMPSAGGQATKTALIQSGGLEDYEVAIDLLKPFTTVYRAS
ncbi:MAG: hypothetical protein ABSB73_12975 [Solirubrobacteraceae bacterium]